MPSNYSMLKTCHQPLLGFKGSRNLVQRLLTSTLTGKPIRVSHIRPSLGANTGLTTYEVSLLRLLEAITNGSQIEFSYTGTTLIYRPGLLVGTRDGYGAEGGFLRHEVPIDCPRGISYFISPLCLLSLFSLASINILFTGPGVITSATQYGDPSIDTLRIALLPLLNQFGVSSNLDIRILRRSCPGSGGVGGAGEVQVILGRQTRLPRIVHLINRGKVRKVRGVAYSSGLPGINNSRVIESARSILNRLVSDINIFSDCTSASIVQDGSRKNSKESKIGIGFGLSLVAETTTACLYSADIASLPVGGETPEDLGRQCAYQLLETIAEGGCVPSTMAPTALTLMAMGSGDVGRLHVGKKVAARENVVQLARDLQIFGAGKWVIEETATKQRDIAISVFGHEIENVGRKSA